MYSDPLILQRAQGSYIAQATNNGTATVNVMLPLTPRKEQNRVRFLRRLHYQYDQIWRQSLQGAARLTLGLNEQPDAVQHHTGLLFRAPRQPERLLPQGTTIAQVFEKAGQQLLILGEPGAGKSTLLLELARYLMERAEQDEQIPMPVIIPLSSWAVKRLPLIGWLRDQLALLYDVPRQLSVEWMRTNQVLPLLDGLDQVPQRARVACIEAITAYRKEHLVPLVICSRLAEYEEIERRHRLVLSNSVVVQPLTREKILTYLSQAGPALYSVRAALQTNPILQELVTIPLMLNVVTLTYAGTSGIALPSQRTPAEQQRGIFAAYIERMVTYKGDAARYPLQRTQTWLNWLARQMQDHHQSVFSLEQLQPDWLSKRRQTLYEWSVRLVGGLIGGILLGILFYALLVILQYPDNALEAALGWGLLPGLIGGIVWRVKSPTRRKSMDIRIWLGKGLWSGALGGVISTSLYALYTWQSNFAYHPIQSTISYLLILLVVEVVSGLSGGLIAALVYGNETYMNIELTEVLTWSKRRLRSGLVEGLGRGLFLGIILGLTFTLTFILASALWNPSDLNLNNILVFSLRAVTASGLGSMLLGMLLGALFGGFSGKQLTERLSLSPNEGLQRFAKHGLFVGSISALVGIFVSVLVGIFVSVLVGIMVSMPMGIMISAPVDILEHSWRSAIPDVLVSALVVGMLGALFGGLAAFIRHYLLRFWLWQTRMFPLRIIHFLNDATSRILLRQVGGGYSFAHQLILDYFASLDNASTNNTPTDNASTPPEYSSLSSTTSPRICEICGYQDIRSEARFCPRCGNPFVPNERER
jgi:hypothetical protein